MSTLKARSVFLASLLLASVALVQPATAIPMGSETVTTPINAGNEMALTTIIDTIMANDGISLLRVNDANDGLWSLLGGGEISTVLIRARFAGNDNVFGFLPGINSGLDGFQAFLPSAGIRDGIYDNNGTEYTLPNLVGDFRLAIMTPSGQILSSRALDNSDLIDHMVTWVNASDPYHYFVAFEDLMFPNSDGDYNDFVLELRNVIDGPESVPEPGSLALLGLGLAGLGYARRRKLATRQV